MDSQNIYFFDSRSKTFLLLKHQVSIDLFLFCKLEKIQKATVNNRINMSIPYVPLTNSDMFWFYFMGKREADRSPPLFIFCTLE